MCLRTKNQRNKSQPWQIFHAVQHHFPLRLALIWAFHPVQLLVNIKHKSFYEMGVRFSMSRVCERRGRREILDITSTMPFVVVYVLVSDHVLWLAFHHPHLKREKKITFHFHPMMSRRWSVIIVCNTTTTTVAATEFWHR